jgi:glycosyltransferase involved in cell wall biosynthesis
MISIIIPTYNEEKIIAATLRTLTAGLASCRDMQSEIIVSDGGSSDRTVELAKPYASKVVVHSGPKRQTISQGRNDGAKAATAGSFYVFLDADCMIPDAPTFFSRAVANFAEDPQLVGLTACLRVLPQEETLGDRIVYGTANFGLWVANNLLRRGHSFGEFQMIRQDAFERLGGFREDLVTIEDADMFFRLSRIGRTRIDPELCVYHTGRRGHQVGWPPLIFMWLVNSAFVNICDRAFTKEWKAIR